MPIILFFILLFFLGGVDNMAFNDHSTNNDGPISSPPDR